MKVQIDHVALYAVDLEGMKDFFIRFFQGKDHGLYLNSKTGFRSYFLTFNGGSRLEIMNRPEVCSYIPQEFQTGFAHISFSVGGRGQVDLLTEELRMNGFEVCSNPRVTGDGYYESCVIGPENNRIEITE